MIDDHLIIEKIMKNLEKEPLFTEGCSPDSFCAAVLIPLVFDEYEWHLLYTRRSGIVASHQNEVSFPGGSYDSNDFNLEMTALRETYEEIGVESNEITIIGALPFSLTITGFKVYPFVGIINWPTKIKINTNEVHSVFKIPIHWLMDNNNIYESDYFHPTFGIRKVTHYREFKGEHLWGFTAKLTQQFLGLLK
jgi:8-oxo-dGTP pyrophosphatase MutT (NUDIX family)